MLTVDVIRDEHDAYVQSVKLRDQSGFLPEKMKRSPLMQGLRILPEGEEETYPPHERRRPDQRRREDRPLYGPSPEIYGPVRPGRRGGGVDTTALETYGPPSRRPKSEPVALQTEPTH